MSRYANANFYVNDANVNNQIKNFVISINLLDIFDYNFTPSQLKLRISSNCNFDWRYKDKIKLDLFWNDYPSLILTTGVFYLDHIVDERSSGNYSYTINAIEADLDKGFVVGNTITYTDQTIDQIITDFANNFNLNLDKNIDANARVGTIPIPDDFGGGVLPGSSSVSIEFDSYAKMLRYISNTYGYFGNITGTDLQVIQASSLQAFVADFSIPNIREVFDFRVEFKYTDMLKYYYIYFADDSTRELRYAQKVNDLPVSEDRKRYIDPTEAYFDLTSASARAYGEYRKAFINAFKIRLVLSGDYNYVAGGVFFLPVSYGNEVSGYYRVIRIVHDIIDEIWTTEIEAFYLDSFDKTDTRFDGHYLPGGQSKDIALTEYIKEDNPVDITIEMVDNYLKIINQSFIESVGNTAELIVDNSKRNGIRTDIVLAMGIIETNNFTFTDNINKKNPGSIGTQAGFGLHTFSSWQDGWLALIQHLWAYADAINEPPDPIVDPRYEFVVRGTATTISSLQDKWSVQSGFSESIKQQILDFYEKSGYDARFR